MRKRPTYFGGIIDLSAVAHLEDIVKWRS